MTIQKARFFNALNLSFYIMPKSFKPTEFKLDATALVTFKEKWVGVQYVNVKSQLMNQVFEHIKRLKLFVWRSSRNNSSSFTLESQEYTESEEPELPYQRRYIKHIQGTINILP